MRGADIKDTDGLDGRQGECSPALFHRKTAAVFLIGHASLLLFIRRERSNPLLHGPATPGKICAFLKYYNFSVCGAHLPEYKDGNIRRRCSTLGRSLIAI